MNEQQKAISMTIKNDSPEITQIQLRVFAWSQQQGNDIFQETNDITISPPFVKLAPDRSYNVRIFNRLTGRPEKEKTYRIIIDEIPRPVDPRTTGEGVKFSLRTSHPLFITPADAIASVTWSMKQDSRGWFISARNDGIRHALLTDVYLIDKTSNRKLPLKVNSINGYILGHSYRDFDMVGTRFAPMAGHHYQIEAMLNGKSVAGAL
ncbi:fimbrial biogenesis chaperone [Salmonella enterica]